MQLYYSGAKIANAPQNLSDQSLGGFISSTIIPNDLVSNIFSVVAKTNITKKQREFRIIYLKNTTGKDLTNLTFFIKDNVGFFVYSFAFLAVTNDYVESFSNKNELPTFEFKKLENGEKFDITDTFKKDDLIAIVILREFNQSFKKQTCSQLHEKFIEKNKSLTDYMNSEIFDVVEPVMDKVNLCFEYEHE